MMRPTVYVVDDDDAVRRSLELWLRSLGMDVRGFGSGEAFLAGYEPCVPCCLVVDLRMPDVGGLDVLRAIRETDPHCQAVRMTGYASVDTAVEAIKLGACQYLVKPSNTDDIEAAFNKAGGDADIDVTPRATSIKTLEWERIHETLAATGFNISETARRLGMHRRTLARKLEKQRVK